MQVNLRGSNRDVSEQIGDHVDPGSGIDGIAAEGMSQLMRADPRRRARRGAMPRPSTLRWRPAASARRACRGTG